LWFEKSTVYDIGLQRYLHHKIRVCGKNSIPFDDLKKRRGYSAANEDGVGEFKIRV